jgi:enoyl-CoA hydratase
MGLVSRVVEAGTHVAAALDLAETLAAFPQPTLRTDRIAALAAFDGPLPDGLANEAALGRDNLTTGRSGAARFAGGEGRGGHGVESG